MAVDSSCAAKLVCAMLQPRLAAHTEWASMNLLHPTRVSANVSSGTSKFMEAFVLEKLCQI